MDDAFRSPGNIAGPKRRKEGGKEWLWGCLEGNWAGRRVLLINCLVYHVSESICTTEELNLTHCWIFSRFKSPWLSHGFIWRVNTTLSYLTAGPGCCYHLLSSFYFKFTFLFKAIFSPPSRWKTWSYLQGYHWLSLPKDCSTGNLGKVKQQGGCEGSSEQATNRFKWEESPITMRWRFAFGTKKEGSLFSQIFLLLQK